MVKVKLISFDLDGTLVDYQFIDAIWFEAIPKLLENERGTSFDAALKLVREEYDKIGPERLEWYDLKYWLEKFGLKHDSKDLLLKFKHRVKLYPEVPDVLRKLHSEGYSLAIITNSPRDFIDVTLQQAEIGFFFDDILSLTSDLERVGKTADVYRKILDMLTVSPSETVHVGDSWIYDFEAPRKIGITSFYLDRKGLRKGNFTVRNLQEFANILLKKDKF